MKWLDTLGVFVAIALGGSLGVLTIDAFGAQELSRDAVLILWAAITGLLGTALGAGIGVKGAMASAKQQIDAAKMENVRRDKILILERELADKTDRLELLSDFSAVLMPFLASIDIISRQTKSIKAAAPLQISSLTTLRTFLYEIDNILAAEPPTSRVHGPSVRREWTLLRHVINHTRPRLEEICRETDDNIHNAFVTHIYDTAYPNLHKRGEEMRNLLVKRTRQLTDEMDHIRSELRVFYEK